MSPEEMAVRFAPQPANLGERHVEALRASGICGDCIDILDRDGLARTIADGLRLNYPGTDFYRVRLDDPKGKMKYTQEAGTGSRLYFSPQYKRWEVGMEPLVITEGEKKALALGCRFGTKMGVIGIGGVWNWTGGKDRDRRLLIEDFNRVDLRGRSAFLCFDSDVETNQQVMKAERDLAKALGERGAKVRIVVLPPERKGIDDWLVAWGDQWRDELRELFKSAITTRSADRYRAIYDRVYTFEEMVGKKFPLPKFFCGDESFGIVGQGMVSIVHGPTNVGKTYLSTQMAVAIATGAPWLGHPCHKSKVLMLQGELPPGLYAKSRLRPLVEYIGSIPDGISFYNWSFNFAESSRFKETFSGDAWAGFQEFEEMLDEHTPGVVFIDPLQSYHNLVETSNDQLRELLKRLKKIAMSRNMGIVVVDHDRKSGGDGPASVRGASAKTDLADTVVGINRGDDGRVVISYDKVRYISRALPSDVEIHMERQVFELGPASVAVNERGQSEDEA